MIRRSIAPKLFLGALLLGGSVYAQEQTRVVVDYVAPAECPPAAAFEQDVSSRLPTGHILILGTIPDPINGNLGLQVRVSKGAGIYRAELTTFTDEGRSSPRNLEGPVCSELMDAMAFTAALTVDPNASSSPSKPSNERSAPSATSASEQPATLDDERIANSASSGASSARHDPTEEEPTEALPPESDGPPHIPIWATSLTAGIVLTAPVSPGVSPGLLVGLRHSDEAAGRWSPAVAVAIFGSQLVSSYSRSASFAAAGAHLEYCPSSFRDHSITIRPCVAGQLTILRATGENLTNAAEVTVASPSVGGHVELRHTLSSQWFLTGLVGAQFTLQRHRFDVGRPAEEVATTRPVAPFVSLQVGSFL